MMMEYNILVSSVGGQGGITLARVLSHAAMSMGLNVRVGETLGMAQRGGSVQSHVRLGDAVHGSLIPEGKSDVLISLEPAETLRVVKYVGGGTTVIMNSRPVLPVSVLLSESDYPEVEEIEKLLGKFASKVLTMDALNLAVEAGTSRSLNVVMLGAYMALGEPVLSLDAIKGALKKVVPASYIEQNTLAFEMGMEEMKRILASRTR
jgi:indolepyruvate ferredoxin oxidoreductase beta subunit